MTQHDYELLIQNKADVADQISNWVEDLFADTFLQAQMIESDIDRKQVLEAQYNAVQALRTLRRTLEARKVAIAFKTTPEGAKECAEYGQSEYSIPNTEAMYANEIGHAEFANNFDDNGILVSIQ